MILPTIHFTIERWKFNEEYGVYVSILGHFKDRHKRNLAYKINQSGYCCIKTEKGRMFAHRLVLLTFRPMPNREFMTVDHLNHNKRDNSLKNLEWVSKEENLERAKRDCCVVNDNDTDDKIAQTDYIWINEVKLPLEQAIKLIANNKSFTSRKKEELKKKLESFLKNADKNLKTVNRYGFTLRRE